MCRRNAILGWAPARVTPSLLATSLVLWSASAVSAQSFAIRQVRVFDGNQSQPGMTVVVRDGIIASVQTDTAIPPDIQVIDGTGLTLLPGLFDSHGHLGDNALTQALAFGVTTVLNMFSAPEGDAERRAEQRKGLANGRADLLSAGLLVTAPGGHGTQYGIPIPTITRPEEAAAAVDTRLAQGSDYIKIIYSGDWCKGCSSIDAATMRAVIEETHARGRKAVVHVEAFEDGRAAIQAGADGIAHLFADRVADADFLALIAERKSFVVTTLTPVAAMGGRRDDGALAAHPSFFQYLSGQDIKNLILYLPTGNPRFQFESAAASLRMLAERRIPILAGSDASSSGKPSGASMHRELELMVVAGLSPTAALQAATSVPAAVFGLPDRGRIAPGLRADLLLVEGDPTTDILATRNLVRIWKNGVQFDRAAYRKALLQEERELQNIRRERR